MTEQSSPISAVGATQAQPLTVWLLSPYHTGSHKAWAEGYQRYSQHRVHLLSLKGRFWKWRMQGGAVELAMQAQKRLAQKLPTLAMPDIVLATDMLHLSVWAGLLRGNLPGTLPLVCYMHENQLTYPWRPGEKPDLTYAMINWLSQLTADRVLFNSQYHLDSWFSELPRLLKHYPDYNNLDLVAKVQQRSSVAPVGIDLAGIDEAEAKTSFKLPATATNDAPLILWNHRWEYDKRPDRFFALLYRLQEAGIPFRLAVAGENFRNVPEEFEEARQRLADAIVHWGYAPTRAEYLSLLHQADLIISTADHEFFGVSVLEAIAAGAFPLLPARLSYPELLPADLHHSCLYADEEQLWHKAARFLTSTPSRSLGRVQDSSQGTSQPEGTFATDAAVQSLRQHLAATYSWPVAAHQTDQKLSAVVAQKQAAAKK